MRTSEFSLCTMSSTNSKYFERSSVLMKPLRYAKISLFISLTLSPNLISSPPAANEFCCRGYCIDLLIELSKRINFTYDLALSPDGQFGHYILRNSSGAMTLRKEWTGLIGELVNERAE